MEDPLPKKGGMIKGLIYSIILTLALGGTSPWWWEKIFPSDRGPLTTTEKINPPVVDPDKPEKTAPVSTRTEEEKIWTINEIGSWGRSKKGDNNVNTQPDHRTKIKCVGFLTYTENSVSLKLIYRVEEMNWDHTTFEGTVINENISSPPPGKKIVQLKIRGNLPVITMQKILIGRHHGPVQFDNLQDTFFDRLSAVVDGAGDDDHNTIGLMGRVKYTVVYDNY